MSRRARLRGLGRLGQSPSLWDLITNPLAVTVPQALTSQYNALVAAREAAANPANAPMASTAALNQALATAQANGVDPGTIQALWMGGADAVQLQIAASSPAQAQAALAPGGALQSVTGQTPAAGQPMSTALLYPAAAQPQLMNYGPLTPDQIAALTSAMDITQTGISTALTGWGAWFQANWPWLALGGIGLWWVSKQL